MQIDYAAIGVLKSLQVVSWWGVPCRTPRCSGFAVLSAMVLKQRAKHMRPTERGVGTCESCGCQYSVKPEQLERRIVEMRKKLRSHRASAGGRADGCPAAAQSRLQSRKR